MSMLISLGLASPVLPDGRVSIHNCPDDDDDHVHEKVLAVARKPRARRPSQKKGGLKCFEIRRENAIKRYGDAFRQLGGTATKTDLASVITYMKPAVIYQYLLRNQGATTRIIGKRGREYVWEWIDGNDQIAA